MIASGHTPVGATNWQVYGSAANAIFVDVDTSAAGFTSVPNYVTSLGGNMKHWEVIGANAVYDATKTKFRVYIRFIDGAPLTPGDANSYGWHIVWMGATSGVFA